MDARAREERGPGPDDSDGTPVGESGGEREITGSERLGKLATALAFYADVDNWERRDDFTPLGGPWGGAAITDRGHRARAILQELGFKVYSK